MRVIVKSEFIGKNNKSDCGFHGELEQVGKTSEFGFEWTKSGILESIPVQSSAGNWTFESNS